jgi:hypothetical protein
MLTDGQHALPFVDPLNRYSSILNLALSTARSVYFTNVKTSQRSDAAVVLLATNDTRLHLQEQGAPKQHYDMSQAEMPYLTTLSQPAIRTLSASILSIRCDAWDCFLQQDIAGNANTFYSRLLSLVQSNNADSVQIQLSLKIVQRQDKKLVDCPETIIVSIDAGLMCLLCGGCVDAMIDSHLACTILQGLLCEEVVLYWTIESVEGGAYRVAQVQLTKL